MKHPYGLVLRASVFTLMMALFALPNITMAKEIDVADKTADIVFSTLEKRLIAEFYANITSQSGSVRNEDSAGNKNKKAKKEGKGHKNGKSKGLPPGLQKQLERNGTLPPGLAKRSLPQGLGDQLPDRDFEFERIIVDNDVLLIQRSTNLIFDIIKDVVVKRVN